MIYKTIISFVFGIASTTMAFSQYHGFEAIDDAKVTKWIPQFQHEYFGAYHFGDSESESTLFLIFSGTEYVAQIHKGEWNSDGTAWVMQYRNLTSIKIGKDGKFSSDQYQGEFVFFDDFGESRKCLKIIDGWSGITSKKGEYELGTKYNTTLLEFFPGKFIMASIQDLDPEELQELTLEELKIMRNEIFARYGYQFRKGGQMDQYFKKTNWYRPQFSNVDDFLTSLEKKNIKLIQQAERDKKF
ncbi:MAG: YARHG domain-containing protein [Bacteroidota bacterium]